MLAQIQVASAVRPPEPVFAQVPVSVGRVSVSVVSAVRPPAPVFALGLAGAPPALA
jgi:hypothetical protein